jgi:hypothetical protein
MIDQVQQNLDLVVFRQQEAAAIVLSGLAGIRQVEAYNVISFAEVFDRLPERGACCQGSIYQDYTLSTGIENMPFDLYAKRIR